MQIPLKFIQIPKTFFVFGTLFSSLLFHPQAEATKPPNHAILIAEVSPVNPLNPTITVDPMPAPPDYNSHSKTKNKEIQKQKSVQKKESSDLITTEKKAKPKKKASKLTAIKNLDSYSFNNKKTDSPIALNDPNEGDPPPNSLPLTLTGELLSGLSGLLLYGTIN
ncbi:hypothetical protein CKN86_07435 [Carnobacterium divergens]|uniref:hypothetical protein n=1 Tax=Carnobacterium divergens TaxID=2748 RepID=UPI000D4D24BB|nr:hypothetical protein [Carnobacterium divergens]MCO6016794.1 hypothetical protein [Carnobacterium divergens]TFI62655.1 hypothetical protein CKN62_07465 [Carnobacterium divergens]TFI89857.1 hypothetical protein CKN84_07465 [Carnobacterium divergens]TFJ03693.1 hypothetical protein CKN86_07435 [Carnobacterium divergens]TFJ06401.1 hypothetical protein CKN65_07470 [Carnobacterium divergens]